MTMYRPLLHMSDSMNRGHVQPEGCSPRHLQTGFVLCKTVTLPMRAMNLPQVMLHPPRLPLSHGGVALDECFAKGALTLCAVALFPSLNF